MEDRDVMRRIVEISMISKMGRRDVIERNAATTITTPNVTQHNVVVEAVRLRQGIGRQDR